MENHTFKSVAFGGFDKQDVISYIEKAAKEAAEAQDRLQQENHDLRAQMESLREKAESLQSQLEVLNVERERLAARLEEETAAREELEPCKPQAEQLAEEVARLRPDAEAYAQFREQIGAIECEARKRAADLERETVVRLEKTVAQFREKYRGLTTLFDTTAAHVTAELRKVEVNLTQLPRAMDQTGTELEELSKRLERLKQENR